MTRELFILPFDHRGSFQEKLFGVKGTPDAEQTREIASYKRIVYEGFERALSMGVPREKAGILVDEQFGAEILKDARAKGYQTSCPAEKSGQDEFDFEYGEAFGEHIEAIQPTFVKVLVRYNPEGHPELNFRQGQRLARLSQYCQERGHDFMFELLVPATAAQLERVGGNVAAYDRELRPRLMVQAMDQLQTMGIEPQIWKVEGIETLAEAKRVADQAQARGRSEVGVIVLGRGENEEKVRLWLGTAAKVPGVVGFAVGRTVFWDALKGVKEGKFSRAEAVVRIAHRYKGFCDLWQAARPSAMMKAG